MTEKDCYAHLPTKPVINHHERLPVNVYIRLPTHYSCNIYSERQKYGINSLKIKQFFFQNSSLFDEFVCKLGLFWHAWAILKRE
jgi:hypothetical protein